MPYLETHDTVNKLIERFLDPFDYTPGFYSHIYYLHILTHDRLNSQKTYTNTSIQTDKEELVSSLSVTTYLNIRKCLDKLQRKQKLENQRSVVNTDLVEIDVNSQFDETAWLNPDKTPAWADYKTQSEPSLESVELAVLRDLYKSDNTSSDTEYIIAAEPTLELPPTFTETDTSQPPRHRKHRYQLDNEETPRHSLRISVQEELEFWFTINSAQYSNEDRQLLKVWYIVKIRLERDNYLEIGNYLYSRNAISRHEAELLNSIYLRDRIADTEPYRIKEALYSLYRILRSHSLDYDIHSDPTSPWADANFSAA